MLKAVCIMLGVAVNALPADIELAPNGRGTSFATLGGPAIRAPPRLIIENQCSEPVLIRNDPGTGEDDGTCGLPRFPNNCQKLAPGGTKKYDQATSEIVLLAWDNFTAPCGNGDFCMQLEFNRPDYHLNFASQFGFSMPIGVQFYHEEVPVAECPEPNLSKCRTGPPGTCKSNKGKLDVCHFDAENECPEKAWKVKTSFSDHSYCLSPDINKAVISADMVNPDAERCQSDPTSWGWVQHGTAGDGKLCSPRTDIATLVDQGLELWDVRTRRKLDADAFRSIESAAFAGGKEYTGAIDSACNQPSTQRITDTEDGKYELDDPSPTEGRAWAADTLDHALVYEGDDVNMWHYHDVRVLMAGNAGIFCDNSEWDTIKVVACPSP